VELSGRGRAALVE